MEKTTDWDILILEQDEDKIRRIAKLSVTIFDSIGDNTDMAKVGLLFKANMDHIINNK